MALFNLLPSGGASLELIVWLIKCTPPLSGGMQLPTRVPRQEKEKEAWIIINKKIRGGSSDAGASGALHNFKPICHLSRSPVRTRTHAAIRMGWESLAPV